MVKASEWAARVEAWRVSGLDVKEFCEGQQYSAKNLQWWSSYLRRKAKPTRSNGKPVELARVVRAPAAVAVSRPVPIVVQFERVRVEVPQGADPTTLAVVFEVLRAGGAR